MVQYLSELLDLLLVDQFSSRLFDLLLVDQFSSQLFDLLLEDQFWFGNHHDLCIYEEFLI